MSHAISALPRRRARTRRPKPPAPWKLIVGVLVITIAACGIADAVHVVAPDGPIDRVASAIGVVYEGSIVVKVWPIVTDPSVEHFPRGRLGEWLDSPTGHAFAALGVLLTVLRLVAAATPLS